MVDLTSGIVCCANNFDYPEKQEGLVRFTFLANPDLWFELSRSEYKEAKSYWQKKTLETVVGFLPDFRDSVVFLDTFTPKTIKKFTGHANGAVYGSPVKIRDGKTPVKNLFICGTDQGFLGIIGATLSGVTVANIYGLKASY
jgi:phytoene dehydrogenase-like protein